MKKQRILAVAIAVMFVLTGLSAFGAKKSSVEMGQEMFNNPQLGDSTNESSCSSCHADGKGLEKVGEAKKLSKLVNNCLVGKMAGSKLDGRLAPMRSLKMYLKSFNGE